MRRFWIKQEVQHDNQPTELVIPTPVYLDYQAVFDMLAVIEEGISQFEEVKTVYSDSKNNTEGVKANLQGKIPLGFLSMNGGGGFSASKSREGIQSNSKEVASKKVHTSVSLFAKLRLLLTKRGMVKQVLSDKSQTGDFVEFKSRFQKIEIVQLMSALSQAVDLGNKFSDKKNRMKMPKEVSEIQNLIKPIEEGFLSCRDINKVRCLIELDDEVTGQFDVERLLRGEYRVFGKIARIEEHDFNIFESTDLGLIKPEYLDSMLSESFNSVVTEDSDLKKMFDIPDEIPIVIRGRVFIVKPIAIFM